MDHSVISDIRVHNRIVSTEGVRLLVRSGRDAKTVMILCEKPDAARRVARALDKDGKPKEKRLGKIPYYEASRGERRLIIVPALGHLYTVTPKTEDRNVYPVFDFYWAPRYMVERGARETEAWISAISRLSKEAEEYILATDYDIEGATLGYTILKYACGGKEIVAKRMKFSTLTADELRDAYEKLLPHIEFPTVEAGICRHFVDAIYGINLSRAMTIAAKKYSGIYTTISTGRVQGPTLSFVVDREKEINSFIPTPYWTVKAVVKIGDLTYEAEYEQEVLRRLDEAKRVVEDCKGENGKITKIDVRRFKQKPPVPFDLGTLQTEAYSFFKYTPRRTANIAERLYLEALISYPRTSSQKLPPSINYEGILKSLSQRPEYKELTTELLTRSELKPNEGRREDPAHPAIYPTGNLPERTLSEPERRLWDLIIRRFMAVFGEPAIKQSVRVAIDVNGHLFYLRGRQILKEGWIRFYKPYTRVEEVLLPPLKEGETLEVLQVIREDKFTKPPSRHNPSSLLKKMEEERIGTKATRADIIETLYTRGYVSGERMVVSELGFNVINILRKYCPLVISVEFTRSLEEKMEMIQNGKESLENVVKEAIAQLKPVLEQLKMKEREIGRALNEAIKKARMRDRMIGACPVCKTGQLMILYSRRTGKRFIGCTNFFKGLCKASFPLPQRGRAKPSGRNCSSCGWPTVEVRIRGRRPMVICFNPDCPSKKGRYT